MKKLNVLVWMVMIVSMCLTSCEKNRDDNALKSKYLAVQFEEEGNWYIVDETGKEVEDAVYPPEAQISQVYDDAYWVMLNDTFRLYRVSSPTKPVNNATYDCVTDFVAGYAVVENTGEPLKIINTKGKVTTQLSSDLTRVWKFSEDGVATFYDSAYEGLGVMNRKGKPVLGDIETRGLETIYSSHDGAILAVDTLANLFRVFGVNGKELCKLNPSDYDARSILRYAAMDIIYYNDGMIILPVKDEANSWAFVDKRGDQMFRIEMDGIPQFKDGYACIFGSPSCIIDRTGTVVSQLPDKRYYWVENLGGGRFLALWEDARMHVDVIKADGSVEATLDGYPDDKKLFGERAILHNNGIHLVDFRGNTLNERPFHAVSNYKCPENVEYVNLKEILNTIGQKIDGFSFDIDIMDLIAQSGTGLKRASYTNGVLIETMIQNTLFSYGYGFSGNLVTAVSHTEYTSEGWRKNVVDGYAPNDVVPERLNMYVKLSMNTTRAKNLEQPVIDFLKSKGFKMSEENLLHRVKNGIVLDVRVRTSTRHDTNIVEINCWIDKE